MKTIIVIFAVCFAAVLGEFTDEQKAKFIAYKESCIGETGIDSNVVKNAKEGVFDENDEKLACFATCMLKKTGMMTENGDIDIDSVRSQVPPEVPQEEVERIIAACKDITGTGCWKGGNVMKCVMENKKVPLVH